MIFIIGLVGVSTHISLVLAVIFSSILSGLIISYFYKDEISIKKKFQKQVEEQKSHQQVLDRKFEELLQQAKDAPDLTPPTKDIDLD